MNNTNRAPSFSGSPGDQTSAEGNAVSLLVAATDPDGDALGYSATGLPKGASINGSTGLISGTLTFAAAGSYNVTVFASDGLTTASVSFMWSVSDVDRPPIVTNPGNRTYRVGDQVSLEIQATDPEGVRLSYRAQGLPPPNINIIRPQGRIHGKLTRASLGVWVVQVSVSDGTNTSMVQFNITVVP